MHIRNNIVHFILLLFFTVATIKHFLLIDKLVDQHKMTSETYVIFLLL